MYMMLKTYFRLHPPGLGFPFECKGRSFLTCFSDLFAAFHLCAKIEDGLDNKAGFGSKLADTTPLEAQTHCHQSSGLDNYPQGIADSEAVVESGDLTDMERNQSDGPAVSSPLSFVSV